MKKAVRYNNVILTGEPQLISLFTKLKVILALLVVAALAAPKRSKSTYSEKEDSHQVDDLRKEWDRLFK